MIEINMNPIAEIEIHIFNIAGDISSTPSRDLEIQLKYRSNKDMEGSKDKDSTVIFRIIIT